MAESEWVKQDRLRREARLREENRTKVAGTLLGVLLVVAILGLTLWMRHSAPCWIFPLHEAPTRCLPGGH